MAPANQPAAQYTRPIVLHPLTVRITHWLNALAIFIMIGSGWRIYNWEPLFGFEFPVWVTFGGWPEVSQRWHNEEGLAGACSGTSRRCGCSLSIRSFISSMG